jgi:hypothetical protein
MTAQSIDSITPSSNKNAVLAFVDEASKMWSPEENDKQPSITVTTSSNDAKIETVEVVTAKNVKSFSVYVITEDGKSVI